MQQELLHIIAGLPTQKIVGKANQVITKLSFDSRQAQETTLFFAVKGTQVDGHAYIPQVLAAGCTAIVCEELPAVCSEPNCFIQVENVSLFMAEVAARFYRTQANS
ncbi:MAG: Mur ligase domain-containing protein [Bacteroidia bacterium]